MWKPIRDYEGYYDVSDTGEVRSLGGRRGSKPRLLKQSDLKGYRRVSLSVDGLRRDALVHRLVAEAFVVNEHNMPHINHIDGVKHHNESSNLEWTDHQGNMTHAWDNGLISNIGEKHGGHKLTEAQVQYIKADTERTDYRAQKWAETYGVSSVAIYDIWAGRTWGHIELINQGLLPKDEVK